MTISMILQVTREQQIEIEEHCLKYGFTFSQYFLKLHTDNTQKIVQEIVFSDDLNSQTDIKETIEEPEKKRGKTSRK